MQSFSVQEYMSTSVLSVSPEIGLQQTAKKMSDARVSCAVVCGETSRPIGVVSERDLTRAYAQGVDTSESILVTSAMSDGVITLRQDESCEKAMRIMGENHIRRLVIVDELKQLVGIVTQSDMLRAHADEVDLQKSLLEKRVQERTLELSAANERLESMARIDSLLGIGNRRAMDEELIRLEERARRYGRSYSVALTDVDYFKKYNDHYGHGAGDEVLKQVADALVASTRTADSVYRYGGEEFLIIFPEVGLSGAAIAAEHVRHAVEELSVEHEDSPIGHLTISVGVAQEDMQAIDSNHTTGRADAALYAAKHSGRNKVSASDESGVVAAA